MAAVTNPVSSPLLMSLDWTQMVSEYSNRHFTFDKDKLPALSGICRSTGFDPADYYAGIWRQAAEHQLLWYPTNAAGEHDFQASMYPRDDPCVPSWSWVQINKKVSFCTPLQQTIWQVKDPRQEKRRLSPGTGVNVLRIKSRVATLKLFKKDHEFENPHDRVQIDEANFVNSNYNLHVTAQPIARHEYQTCSPLCWNFTLTIKLLKDFGDLQQLELDHPPRYPSPIPQPSSTRGFSLSRIFKGVAPSSHVSPSLSAADGDFLLLFAGVVGANRADGSVKNITEADSVVGLVLCKKDSYGEPQGVDHGWERVGIFYDEVNGWSEWERWTREEELDII